MLVHISRISCSETNKKQLKATARLEGASCDCISDKTNDYKEIQKKKNIRSHKWVKRCTICFIAVSLMGYEKKKWHEMFTQRTKMRLKKMMNRNKEKTKYSQHKGLTDITHFVYRLLIEHWKKKQLRKLLNRERCLLSAKCSTWQFYFETHKRKRVLNLSQFDCAGLVRGGVGVFIILLPNFSYLLGKSWQSSVWLDGEKPEGKKKQPEGSIHTYDPDTHWLADYCLTDWLCEQTTKGYLGSVCFS